MGRSIIWIALALLVGAATLTYHLFHLNRTTPRTNPAIVETNPDSMVFPEDKRRNECGTHLRMIDSLKEEMFRENEQEATAAKEDGVTASYVDPTNACVNFKCPSGGYYKVTGRYAPSACSIPSHNLR
ncbi:MAG: hypothetical protein V4526_00445 [Patescibacteria group bacterium]